MGKSKTPRIDTLFADANGFPAISDAIKLCRALETELNEANSMLVEYERRMASIKAEAELHFRVVVRELNDDINDYERRYGKG